ncbi:MAG: DUF4421 family protein [Crocinitomicaceae bacterium]|nr:DUF4421 family protein [Crocinitomicaceae bacterium]MDG1777553.1 DUF4421 family protein [Crocinitomicaceae bacterium]
MKKTFYIFVWITCQVSTSAAQTGDTVNYQLFKEHIVIFSDLGFNSAPFNIRDHYALGVKKVNYRNNIKPVVGVGVAYKWFVLRVGFTIPLNILNETKFGDPTYFDFGFKANIKQTFCNLSFRNYSGYAVENAYKFNDSITPNTQNALMPSTRSTSISANVWYLGDKSFKMAAFQGRSAHFTGEAKTWYLKGTLNYFGVSNDSRTIIPTELTDSTDIQNAQGIGAIDLGVIPGYAYANRVKNWQFGMFLGLGGVIQSKYYLKDDVMRSFLGLAPRLDLKFSGGYSRPDFFILLVSDFDVKSLKIQALKYNQTYYNIRIVSGFRF